MIKENSIPEIPKTTEEFITHEFDGFFDFDINDEKQRKISLGEIEKEGVEKC